MHTCVLLENLCIKLGLEDPDDISDEEEDGNDFDGPQVNDEINPNQTRLGAIRRRDIMQELSDWIQIVLCNISHISVFHYTYSVLLNVFNLKIKPSFRLENLWMIVFNKYIENYIETSCIKKTWLEMNRN